MFHLDRDRTVCVLNTKVTVMGSTVNDDNGAGRIPVYAVLGFAANTAISLVSPASVSAEPRA